MRVNQYGKIAHRAWMDLPSHYPQVTLDAFIVMPNHVHGIVLINEMDEVDRGRGGSQTCPYESGGLIISNGRGGSPSNGESMPGKSIVSGENVQDADKTRPYKMMQHGLSEIVRAFKSFSARRINQIRNMHGVAVWQRSYYDHIIRNEEGFENIWKYIETNPENWQKDEFH